MNMTRMDTTMKTDTTQSRDTVTDVHLTSDPLLHPAKMRAEDVCVFYGEKQALFDVNLDIAANQVTALIGPSGCGKSTFSTLSQPDERYYRHLPDNRENHPR